MLSQFARLFLSLTFSCLAAAPLFAQVVPPPPEPQVGSANTVTADPPVPRPHGKSCVVQLYQNVAFDDFNLRPFTYTPPKQCPGPWSKVVFAADFTVQVGRQFDRTASVYLDNVNLYYGTTAEPRANLSPTWHVERDVTELSSIFTTGQSGAANLGNFVGTSGGVTYNSIIFGDASLEFYQASFFEKPAKVADVVVPLPNSSGPATLNSSTPNLTQAITLPPNVESVFMDVIAQSQNQEEQWFFCVPNDVAAELQSCGNTGFRETEISIDGQPAGVAPVYPWIYTGGIDPYLWAPIPGLQTLNFKPFRVDLTPFAGVLADGNAHSVAISVFNAYQYFLVDATLLAYTDHGAKRTTGAVTSDSLTEPAPAVDENLSTAQDGTISGTVTVTAGHNFAISGYLNTSHGRVETTVEEKADFQNSQYFLISSSQYTQNLQQSSTVQTKTTTRDGFVVVEKETNVSYPFTFDLTQNVSADGKTITEPNVSNQQYLVETKESLFGIPLFQWKETNQVQSQDTDTIQLVNGGYALTGHSGQKSSQDFLTANSAGACYSRVLTAANSVLTGVTDGTGCPSGVNRW